MSSRLSQVLLSTTLIVSYAFSQTVPKVAPLPYDPLELATGPTVVPDTPEQRAVLLNLLERARQNSAMHTPGTAPFTLKVSFNSTGGDSHSQGYGEVEETWLNGQTWRWSARLGDYSQLRIFYDAVGAGLQLIQHATSLGAVESTIERRASIPGQEHLPQALLRLSVGIEAVEDL